MKVAIDILKRIAIVVVSIFVGGYINMFLISNSSKIIPPPAGANLTTEEGLKAAMPMMEPKHFVMPFLAHAFGTLVAAFLITVFLQLVFKKSNLISALISGFCFLMGGIIMVLMLPSPIWFTITDLVVAYIPMAYIGYVLGNTFFKQKNLA